MQRECKGCKINKPGDWNKRGGWKKSKKSINVEGGNVRGGQNFFFKINKRASTFIREMRVVKRAARLIET